MVEEMIKFRKMLDKLSINWKDDSDELIDRTHFTYNNIAWSAINGLGTYGGLMNGTTRNSGLIELWDGINEPIGWQTAEEALRKVLENE